MTKALLMIPEPSARFARLVVVVDYRKRGWHVGRILAAVGLRKNQWGTCGYLRVPLA